MAIKLGIIGAAGRMGRRIAALACQDHRFTLCCGLEKPDHPAQGLDLGELIGQGKLDLPIASSWSKAPQVAINFSSPQGTTDSLAQAQKDIVFLVVGIIGLDAAQLGVLAQAAKNIPLVHAANMSLGVNLLFHLVGQVAKALGPDYDIEITETHHRFKKDAPSGTALELARQICAATGRDFDTCLRHGRSGTTDERQPDTIGMHALRQGDVVGQHTVSFGTLGETVEITHRAHSRDIFARGALTAAAWLVNKKPGLYDMLDVLELKK